MTFQWIQYLYLAEKLRDGLSAQPSADADQAAIRCSISRAYYAAHWHTRNYLETNFQDFSAGKHDVHIAVVNKMKYAHGELARIGDQLDRLRLNRIEFDYRSRCAFSKNDYESALLRAKNITDRLQTFS